jgi:hypothetical protein
VTGPQPTPSPLTFVAIVAQMQPYPGRRYRPADAEEEQVLAALGPTIIPYVTGLAMNHHEPPEEGYAGDLWAPLRYRRCSVTLDVKVDVYPAWTLVDTPPPTVAAVFEQVIIGNPEATAQQLAGELAAALLGFFAGKHPNSAGT